MVLLAVRTYGDELSAWATQVKEMLAYDDLLRQGYYRASPLPSSYIGLWSSMGAASLALAGQMSDGTGRIITFCITLAGASFIYTWLRRRFDHLGSAFAAATAYVLFFSAHFLQAAGWFADAGFAVWGLVSTCCLVSAFEDKGRLDVRMLALFSLFESFFVFTKIDGFLFLPLHLAMGLGLAVQSKLAGKMIGRVLLSFLPPIALSLLWRVWEVVNGFHLGTSPTDILVNAPIPPLVVLRGMATQLVSLPYSVFLWPFVPSLVAILALGYVLRTSLTRQDWLVILLLLFPAYRLFSLILVWMFSWGASAGAEAAGFSRYESHSSYITYFVLGWLVLRWLGKARPFFWQSKSGVFLLRASLAVVVALNLGVAWFMHCLPFDYSYYMESLATQVIQEHPEIKRLQFIAQDSPHNIRRTFAYYATPDVVTTFASSISPSISSSAPPGVWWEHISNRVGYIDYLARSRVDGVLVYESNVELDAIMDVKLDRDRVYLFAFREGTLVPLWSEQRPYSNVHGDKWMTRALLSMRKDISTLFGILRDESAPG